MCSLIALKFGINKEHTKVNSGTEFGMNLISTVPALRVGKVGSCLGPQPSNALSWAPGPMAV